jgi:hypothetical protein
MSALGFTLQKAIFTAIAAAVTPTPVYDAVPKGSAYPYVTVGEDVESEWDTKTDTGEDVDVVIHQWSRYQGRKEIKDLQSSIYTALHYQGLTLEHGAIVLLKWQSSETFMDEDGVTRHGVMRFRALLSG